MIEELRRERIEKVLESSEGKKPIPGYEDSDAWRELTSNPMLNRSPDEAVASAKRLLDEPLEMIPASLYLNYRRTGSRSPHDGIKARRRSRLAAFVLAECIEREGTFMDPIMDHVWAICEESSWVIPAHSSTPLPPVGEITWADLVASHTAMTLGETVQIIGRRLDEHQPSVLERIVYELQRRCWNPYLVEKDLRWLYAIDERGVNNWNAVCNCGIVGSAILALDDNAMLARMIETCLRSLNDYLRSFDPDGGSSEGPSYWSYGVTHYVWLSYLLSRRTRGAINPLKVVEMRDIARFPQRVTLTGNAVVNFSDCPPRVNFSPALLFHLGSELGLPDVSAFAQSRYDISAGEVGYALRELLWMPRERYAGEWTPEPCTFFKGQKWWISRAEPGNHDSLMVAAKGGNNDENHNQNDVGNFTIHAGGETLIVDLGSGTYTRDYFGTKRYDILVNNSWGHNVPLVDGCQQGLGAEYAAEVLDVQCGSELDSFHLDLADAYPPEAGMESLKRSISLSRGIEPFVTITDRIVAGREGIEYVLPLYTLGTVNSSGSSLVFSGDSASILVDLSPSDLELRVEDVALDDEKLPEKVRRAVLTLSIQDAEAEVNLNIHPA
jgi:hypothetical protein